MPAGAASVPEPTSAATSASEPAVDDGLPPRCAGARPATDATAARWRGVAAVVLVAVAGVVPGFTLGALATPIEADLAISGPVLGLLLACFFVCSALGSVVTRRLTDLLPVPLALGLVAVVASGSMLLAANASGVVVLAAAMVLAGLGNALVQPAAARFVAAEVPATRISLATGLVGAALGAAPFVPGLLVAVVAGPHGWRAAMTVGAILAAVTVLAVPLARSGATAGSGEGASVSAVASRSPAASARPPARGQSPRVALWWWMAAAGLGAVGVNVAATAFVRIGTSSGLAAPLAGVMLSVASVVAVAVRITAGAAADRAPDRTPGVVALMMACGALGFVVMVLGGPVAFVVGAVLAVAGGWGWTGLLLAATMRLIPDEPTRAGAVVQTGMFGGAAIAPPAFGVLAVVIGIPTTVALFGLASLAGAGAVLAGSSAHRRATAEAPPTRTTA